MGKIWECKIGESENVKPRSDGPMRQAIAQAYTELTGEHPKFILSGWDATLSEPERAAVEDREPKRPDPTVKTRLGTAEITIMAASREECWRIQKMIEQLDTYGRSGPDEEDRHLTALADEHSEEALAIVESDEPEDRE
jgi:hypothetical protein